MPVPQRTTCLVVFLPSGLLRLLLVEKLISTGHSSVHDCGILLQNYESGGKQAV